jgi:hypothetical protein
MDYGEVKKSVRASPLLYCTFARAGGFTMNNAVTVINYARA